MNSRCNVVGILIRISQLFTLRIPACFHRNKCFVTLLEFPSNSTFLKSNKNVIPLLLTCEIFIFQGRMITDDDEQDFFMKLVMLDLIRKLRSHPGVSNVKIEKKTPCSRLAVRAWEQNVGFKLPSDMKEFYASTDGLNFAWSTSQLTNINEGEMLILTGEIKANPLGNLHRLHFVNQRMFNNFMHSCYASPKLNLREDVQDVLNNESKVLAAFVISYHNKLGSVCLVYHSKHSIAEANNSPDTSSSIWLLDAANYWHFLANNFSTYFRMAIVHLGLEKWQSCFTSYGPTATTQRILMYLTPNLLKEMREDGSSDHDNKNIPQNVIDPNIFKIVQISSQSKLGKQKINKK